MLITPRTARHLGLAMLLLTAPALAACSTELPTDKIYTPATGANDRTSRVDVLNAMVVANAATKGDAEHATKGTLIFTLVNNESAPVLGDEDHDDALAAVTAESVQISRVSKRITIPAGAHVVVARKTSSIPNAVEPFTVTGDFDLGDYITVTFNFANAKPVELKVPVVENITCSPMAGQNGTPDPAVAQSGPDEHAAEEGGHAEGRPPAECGSPEAELPSAPGDEAGDGEHGGKPGKGHDHGRPPAPSPSAEDSHTGGVVPVEESASH